MRTLSLKPLLFGEFPVSSGEIHFYITLCFGFEPLITDVKVTENGHIDSRLRKKFHILRLKNIIQGSSIIYNIMKYVFRNSSLYTDGSSTCVLLGWGGAGVFPSWTLSWPAVSCPSQCLSAGRSPRQDGCGSGCPHRWRPAPATVSDGSSFPLPAAGRALGPPAESPGRISSGQNYWSSVWLDAL